MTTQELTALAVPQVRHALKRARPMIAKELGRLGWILFRPFWSVLTGPMLPLLTRIGVELATGLAAPRFLPLLLVLDRVANLISEKYLPEDDKRLLAELTELLATPRNQMHAAVQETLGVPMRVVEAAS